MALNANALTTYATVKAEIGLTSDTDQAVIERYINAASAAAEAYCSRVFGRGTGITETIRGNGGVRIVLSRVPLVSIASVTMNGDTLDASSYSIEDNDAGIVFRETGWPRLFLGETPITVDPIGDTEKPWLVFTFTGGYTLPASGAGYNLPADIEEACILGAVARYRRKGLDENILSERLGDASYTYAGGSQSGSGHFLPDTALQLLEPHRRLGA